MTNYPSDTTCAECGDPHASLREPLEDGDWLGLLPLCEECWKEYYLQSLTDQSYHEETAYDRH